MELFITKQDERIKELEEDLSYWANQYGCKCGHPHCSRCKDTEDTTNLLNKSKVTALNA